MTGRSHPPSTEHIGPPKGFDDYDVLLGDIMRGERATLGKSLLDVQRELKIKANYIAAIENADPSVFETPGFIAGYVRSYARYLGLDPEWAYATFCEEAGFETAHGMSTEASSRRRAKAERVAAGVELRDPLSQPATPFIPTGESKWANVEAGAIGSVAVLLALVGVISYGGWSVFKEIQRVEIAPIEQSAGLTTTVDPLSSDALPQTEAAPQMPNVAQLEDLYRQPQVLDVPIVERRDGPISTIDPNAVGAFAELETDAPLAPQLVPSPSIPDASGIQVVEADLPGVTIFAIRPAWVRVTAADGTVLLQKTLDAGERFALPESDAPAVLRAGNAGSVYFDIAGATYGPAGEGATIAREVSLAAQDLKSSFTVADLSADPVLARIVSVAEAETAAPEEAAE